MNLALKSFSKIMRVHSLVDSEDLYEVMKLHVEVHVNVHVYVCSS